jgi:monoamine oxidase
MQHRREFFTQSGLALAGGCGTFHRGLAREVNRNARRKQVVIIGAGLSGLAAARDLQQNQYDVVVIEARDRIGGRVWTSEKWADAVLDLGASWIHGVEDNPLTALADQAGATRVVTDYDNAITYTTSGRPLSNSERVRLKRIDRDVSRAIQRAQQADDDMSVRQAIAPLLRQADEFSDVRQFVDYLLSSEFEHEYAGSAADLSAFWFDSSQNFDGDDVLLAEGLGSLAEFLARGLNIELGQVVQTIDWTKSPVRVVTEKSEFLADQVIVTLPLGVLQECDRHPAG